MRFICDGRISTPIDGSCFEALMTSSSCWIASECGSSIRHFRALSTAADDIDGAE